MAPNLKHFSQLTAPLAGPKAVRVKQAANYQPRPAAAPAVDSASYWEWPTPVEPAQLVSAEHIEANLVEAAAEQPAEQQQGKSVLDVSMDDYWAEETVSVQEEPEHDESPPVSQQEQAAIDPNDYWAETSHKYNESDDYWNTSAKVEKVVTVTPPSATTIVRNAAVNPSESDAYWQEATPDNKSANDAYWRESRPAESADGDYWTWDVQTAAMAESDRYWTWNSMTPAKLALESA